jgi:hypothetical protein
MGSSPDCQIEQIFQGRSELRKKEGYPNWVRVILLYVLVHCLPCPFEVRTWAETTSVPGSPINFFGQHTVKSMFSTKKEDTMVSK